MALAPINPTQLTPPRVALIDERSGAISREWYRFFLSLLTATQTTQAETELSPDTSSLLASYDAMLADLAQATESAPNSNSFSASLESQLYSLDNEVSIAPPSMFGTVTSVAASGGTTGLTFTGSPITTSGTLTLGGTLAVASGGTGQTTYTNGQLLIGNTTGNTLTKATLTAGTNVTISNGAGAITINATDQFVGTVTSVSVVSANGFAGTVATSTTTPAITLTTTITGVLKGDGTAISAATKDVDYFAPSAPITKTADFTVGTNENFFINNKTATACTVTFPAASSWSGRQITIKNMQAQLVNSASSNVVPIDSTSAGTAVLLNVVGNWATLLSDGTNWVIMAQSSNNNLLLE